MRVARAIRRALARIWLRLLLVNVVVVAIPQVGISFARIYERQLLAGLERDMAHQAELVRAVIERAPSAIDDDTLALAARDTRARIRLLDRAGAVIADSHRDGPPEGAEPPSPHLLRASPPPRAPQVPKPLDVAQRPEVARALAGRYGAATRLWEHGDRVFLFVAIPIRDARGGAVYVTRSTRDVKLELFVLRAWLVKVLLGAIVLTALISIVLATTIARPLDRLTRRARRIAARAPVGDDAELVRRHDEIGELARALASMTAELERRAREARELAADLGHELKTPLTGIRGAAELLADGAADDPDARARFLAMILADAARLDRLVSRLMEHARLDDDRGAVAPLDARALARTACARAWAVPVALDDDDAPATIAGRAPALAAALDNLIANATQHADPGSTVRVRVTAADQRVRIAVANRGPALSDVARERVWDRFYSTRHAEGGTGLGLAIVRAVATAHGGTCGVACVAGMTTFWIELVGLVANQLNPRIEEK